MKGIALAIIVFTSVVLLAAGSIQAATCTVPSGPHPTIRAALDDGTCTEIVVAAGEFPESPMVGRSLTLTGAGSDQTIIQGQVVVQAGSVLLQTLGIQTTSGSYQDALQVADGAEVSGVDLVVVNGGALVDVLFADGFETGDTSGWDDVFPR